MCELIFRPGPDIGPRSGPREADTRNEPDGHGTGPRNEPNRPGDWTPKRTESRGRRSPNEAKDPGPAPETNSTTLARNETEGPGLSPNETTKKGPEHGKVNRSGTLSDGAQPGGSG
jgi:hypothetical protein